MEHVEKDIKTLWTPTTKKKKETRMDVLQLVAQLHNVEAPFQPIVLR